MVVVKKKKGESEDRLIARFKKISLDVVQEARDRKHFVPKSEKRKLEKYRQKHVRELERKRAKQI